MMDSLELIKAIARPLPSKIVLLVIDGVGGLPFGWAEEIASYAGYAAGHG